jgi:hypothetical protein
MTSSGLKSATFRLNLDQPCYRVKINAETRTGAWAWRSCIISKPDTAYVSNSEIHDPCLRFSCIFRHPDRSWLYPGKYQSVNRDPSHNSRRQYKPLFSNKSCLSVFCSVAINTPPPAPVTTIIHSIHRLLFFHTWFQSHEPLSTAVYRRWHSVHRASFWEQT